jgi:hypothetical protein
MEVRRRKKMKRKRSSQQTPMVRPADEPEQEQQQQQLQQPQLQQQQQQQQHRPPVQHPVPLSLRLNSLKFLKPDIFAELRSIWCAFELTCAVSKSDCCG